MASAKFMDVPVGFSRSIELYLWKKSLTEIADVWENGRTVAGKKTRSATEHPSPAAAGAAYERRCAELLEGGWHDGTFGGRKIFGGEAPKRASAKTTEAALERISAGLAGALMAAKGDRAAERSAIEGAVKEYRVARTAAGEPPDEFIVHFFAVDGVGLKERRVPALTRPKVAPVVRAGWLATLESLVAPTGTPKKTATKKTATKKTASKKTASKKTATKKTATKKTASKKTASKKTASKKTASKKTATKKTATKKATRR